MPRANLDLLDPGGSDFFDGTTELESGDESSSYKKRNRSYEYSNKGNSYTIFFNMFVTNVKCHLRTC